MSLNSNQLTGDIPAELGNLANLQGLFLSDNQLSGAIPAELGNLANIETLWLSYNELTGAIPAELDNLANIVILDLSNNKLTGDIPMELGNLANIETLFLHGNQFTGCIPLSLREPLDSWEIDGIERIGLPLCEAATTAPSSAPISAPPASGSDACIERIALGERISGSWSSACLSANPPDDNTYYARFYTFTLDAAARVTTTLSSTDASPCLYLLDGVGTGGYARKVNCYPGIRAVNTLFRLRPGDYTIEATTYAPEAHGDFTLLLRLR